MNKKSLNLAKMICLLTMILASISCMTRNTEKTNPKGNIVLDFQNDTLNYKVYENQSKINSDNIDQCEKFLEYKNSPKSIEIYGADIADLYAIFFGKNRDNVQLNNKGAIFYTVIYNGKQNDSVKKDIINHLLNKRNLKVSESTKEINAYRISIGNADKITKYISGKSIEGKSKMVLTDDNYEITNADLSMLAIALNDLYPNTFFSENNDVTKYNLKIPLEKDIDSIIAYLYENYGIVSNPIANKVNTYEVKDKE
ncbi:hypothetical protein [Avrilella dinanensis]|uniref:hypothetical protein n=1 Tax=Avrilella dinanensis TaxID=2008672 RepID=UPI002409B9F8|nr:hypothetical protein [Avrilella dinanensis]